MAKNAARPTILFSWIGVVDCWVAIHRLVADGTMTKTEGERILGTFEKPGDRYIKDGRLLPLAKSQPHFDAYHILTNHASEQIEPFRIWFQRELDALGCEAKLEIHSAQLENPSSYEQVFGFVEPFMRDIRNRYPSNDFDFAYYLSPGTSAMSNTWLLLSLTRFPGDTYQFGSVAHAPTKVDLPFDMRMDFKPHLLPASLGVPSEASLPNDILGDSPLIESAKRLATRFAPFSQNVLLLGASGVGKEVFAEVIHRESGRRGDLQIVNCAAFTDELFAAEMFGVAHDGAFTGARKGPGHFTVANGSTLFLDEVGDLSLVNQARLLRALQPRRDALPTERRFIPIGGKEELTADVRIIAATNRDLAAMAQQGTFRDDLLHRLAVLTIRVPSLADRQGDMLTIIDHFVDRTNAENKAAAGDAYTPKRLAASTYATLERTHWPGNIRQLRQIIARAIAIAETDEVRPGDVEEALSHDARSPIASILDRPLDANFRLRDVELELRRHYICRAIQMAKNGAKASRLLGYDNAQTFRNHASELDIDLDAFKAQ